MTSSCVPTSKKPQGAAHGLNEGPKLHIKKKNGDRTCYKTNTSGDFYSESAIPQYRFIIKNTFRPASM